MKSGEKGYTRGREGFPSKICCNEGVKELRLDILQTRKLICDWLSDSDFMYKRASKLDTQSTSDHIYLHAISIAVVFRPSHQI